MSRNGEKLFRNQSVHQDRLYFHENVNNAPNMNFVALVYRQLFPEIVEATKHHRPRYDEHEKQLEFDTGLTPERI